MFNWKINACLEEIRHQGRATEIAWEHYESALEDLESRTKESARAIDECFMAVQSILTSAALVSKLLWMSNPTPQTSSDPEPDPLVGIARERCKAVRKTLHIKSIPVLESRRVRNSIEHFDSRLDEFFEGIEAGVFVDRNIGPVSHAVVVNGKPPRFLRHIDPTTNTMIVLDESVDFGAVAKEVIRLAAAASAARA